MAFRGRGRGRGFGGGGGYPPAKQVPFELFPEIELPDPKNIPEEMTLILWGSKLERFWTSSPYYFENQDRDIKRKEDAESGRTTVKVPLSHFIKMTDEYVPAELAIKGQKQRRPHKKVRWNPDSDLKKLDLFEKLEQRTQDQDEKGGNEKDEEEVDDENVEEDEEEGSDGGDYGQNIDFEDDEDDFNIVDDNDDEPIY